MGTQRPKRPGDSVFLCWDCDKIRAVKVIIQSHPIMIGDGQVCISCFTVGANRTFHRPFAIEGLVCMNMKLGFMILSG